VSTAVVALTYGAYEVADESVALGAAAVPPARADAASEASPPSEEHPAQARATRQTIPATGFRKLLIVNAPALVISVSGRKQTVVPRREMCHIRSGMPNGDHARRSRRRVPTNGAIDASKWGISSIFIEPELRGCSLILIEKVQVKASLTGRSHGKQSFWHIEAT
jgi:hypothetical protein